MKSKHSRNLAVIKRASYAAVAQRRRSIPERPPISLQCVSLRAGWNLTHDDHFIYQRASPSSPIYLAGIPRIVWKYFPGIFYVPRRAYPRSCTFRRAGSHSVANHPISVTFSRAPWLPLPLTASLATRAILRTVFTVPTARRHRFLAIETFQVMFGAGNRCFEVRDVELERLWGQTRLRSVGILMRAEEKVCGDN